MSSSGISSVIRYLYGGSGGDGFFRRLRGVPLPGVRLDNFRPLDRLLPSDGVLA
jgi:hypothetical protein